MIKDKGLLKANENCYIKSLVSNLQRTLDLTEGARYLCRFSKLFPLFNK